VRIRQTNDYVSQSAKLAASELAMMAPIGTSQQAGDNGTFHEGLSKAGGITRSALPSSFADTAAVERQIVPDVFFPDDDTELTTESSDSRALCNVSAWSSAVLDDSPGVSGAVKRKGGGDMWNEAISEKQATMSLSRDSNGAFKERLQLVRTKLEEDRKRGYQQAQTTEALKRLEEERRKEQILKNLEERRTEERLKRESEQQTVNLDQQKEDLAQLMDEDI